MMFSNLPIVSIAHVPAIDPSVHVDEIKVIRDALVHFSCVVSRTATSAAVSPKFSDIRCMIGILHTVISFVWWMPKRNVAGVRDESSPDSLLDLINERREDRLAGRAKEEAIGRLTMSITQTAQCVAQHKDESRHRYQLVTDECLMVAKTLSDAEYKIRQLENTNYAHRREARESTN